MKNFLKTPLPEHEAQRWLYGNSNPQPLAGNRFAGKQDALAFVEQLYFSGAKAVYVRNIWDEAWRLESLGGPYATGLLVELPEKKEARQVLFEIFRREITKAFQDEMRIEDIEQASNDVGQVNLLFWWD